MTKIRAIMFMTGSLRMHGEIKNSEVLTNVKQFPVDKIKIIALYLDF